MLVGFGREAKSTLYFFKKQGIVCTITIADKQKIEGVPEGIQVYTGLGYLEDLPFFDFVFKSPGVPNSELERYFLKYPDSVLTSGTAVFLEKHRDKVIGVTGTKGKSTTSSLVAHLLNVAGRKLILAGNIGVPALDVYDEDPDYFVLELSSYQLEDLRVSPARAVFLNIYEEHLDYHGNFGSYLKAKSNIAKFQTEEDLLVVPRGQDQIERELLGCGGRREYYGPSEKYFQRGDEILCREKGSVICKVSELPIKGARNVENVLACLTLLYEFDISLEKLREGLLSFKPLPHRLEEVGVVDGVLYVNDSIATMPEACISAIDVYQDSLDTIILGGFDRGLDFSRLGERVVATNVRNVILFMPSGARIREAIEKSFDFDPDKIKFFTADSMDKVFSIAKAETQRGKTCLLSPASPSFFIFKNFEERGDLFREGVRLASF